MQLLRKKIAFWFRKEFIANISIIILSIIFAFIKVFAPQHKGYETSVIILLLSIVAFNSLVEQYKWLIFKEKIFSLGNRYKQITDFLIKIGDLPRFQDRVEKAEEIWITGFTMTGFLLNHKGTLKKLVKNGVKIKILLSPKDGNTLTYICSFYRDIFSNRSNYLNYLKASLTFLEEIGKDKNFELRTYTVMPTHHLIIINPKRESGELQVHLNMYNRDSEDCPLIVIRKLEATELFDMFKTEFESLWNESKKYSR